jgi:hypothetical protein
MTAVIEVKGCWNGELFTAIAEQLVSDYMVDLKAPVGIFLVGWFDDAQWDKKDSRRSKVPKIGIAGALEKLQLQSEAVPAGFKVAPVILDIRAPGT